MPFTFLSGSVVKPNSVSIMCVPAYAHAYTHGSVHACGGACERTSVTPDCGLFVTG